MMSRRCSISLCLGTLRALYPLCQFRFASIGVHHRCVETTEGWKPSANNFTPSWTSGRWSRASWSSSAASSWRGRSWPAIVSRALALGDRLGRGAADSRELTRERLARAARRHLVHEANLPRLEGGKRPRAQGQITDSPRGDAAEQKGRDQRRYHPQDHLGQHEGRLRRGEHEIAGGREAHAAAVHLAFDAGDDRQARAADEQQSVHEEP